MSRTALAVFLTAFMAAPGEQAVGSDADNNYVGSVVEVITDAETQRPVRSAQVFIGELELGSLTRRDGNYAIHEVPEGGPYVMTLRHPCYLSVSVEIEISQSYEQPVIVHVGLPLKPRLTSQRFSPPLGGPC